MITKSPQKGSQNEPLNTIATFFKNCIKNSKKMLRLLIKISRKNRGVFERFQLTFIYLFAIVVLMYSIRNSLGYFPEILFTIFPFLAPIFDIQALQILASPEKTIFFYFIVLEFCLNRPYFSLLVKFNVLLIFLLEMFQNLILCYWDLLFNRELISLYGDVVINRSAMMMFSTVLFSIYLALYLYAYVRSMAGLFPVFPGILRIFTNSVAFWLQIKNKKKDK